MAGVELGIDDIVYLADMLQAVRFYASDLIAVSPSTLNELESTLDEAEAVLRQTATEMSS